MRLFIIIVVACVCATTCVVALLLSGQTREAVDLAKWFFGGLATLLVFLWLFGGSDVLSGSVTRGRR